MNKTLQNLESGLTALVWRNDEKQNLVTKFFHRNNMCKLRKEFDSILIY